MRGVITAKKLLLFSSIGAVTLSILILFHFNFYDLRRISSKNFNSVNKLFTDTYRSSGQSLDVASILKQTNAEQIFATLRREADNAALSLRSASFLETSMVDVPTMSDEAFRERMEALQKARQARLLAVCGNGSNVKTDSMGTVFNFHNLDLTYCCIAKCASTTFKMFLDSVTGRKCAGRSIHDCSDSRFKQSRSRADFRTNSLVIVRNPWERLVSSYTNKFVDEKLGKAATPCYKHHGKDPNGYTITFAEFVECIRHDVETGQTLNFHVAPVSWHCSPCDNRFSYIATLETFPDDLNYLFRYVLPKTKSADEYWSAVGQIRRRSSEVANKTRMTYDSSYKSLSKEQLNLLVAVYRADALLYGYSTHPLNDENN